MIIAIVPGKYPSDTRVYLNDKDVSKFVRSVGVTWSSEHLAEVSLMLYPSELEIPEEIRAVVLDEETLDRKANKAFSEWISHLPGREEVEDDN